MHYKNNIVTLINLITFILIQIFNYPLFYIK